MATKKMYYPRLNENNRTNFYNRFADMLMKEWKKGLIETVGQVHASLRVNHRIAITYDQARNVWNRLKKVLRDKAKPQPSSNDSQGPARTSHRYGG